MKSTRIFALTAACMTLSACSGAGSSTAAPSTLSLQGARSVSGIPASQAYVLQPITRSADTFTESVGVDSHFSHQNSPEYQHFASVAQWLIMSGIHHLRDGSVTLGSTYLSMFAYLGQHGITHSAAIPFNTSSTGIDAALKTQDPYVDSVELQNEADATGAGWISKSRAEQNIIYSTVKQHSSTWPIQVLAPSLSHTSNATLLGAVPADASNLHNATCNFLPETTTSAGIFPNTALITPEAPGKPVWTTETGYDNDPTSVCYITQAGAAIYIPRTVAARFNAGEPRIEFDTLADNPHASHFAHMGLLNGNATPKMQFFALASLLQLLADPGPAYIPAQLPLTIASASPTIQATLLGKRDGTYDLLLWQAAVSYNAAMRSVNLVPSLGATVSFPRTPRALTLYTYHPTTWLLHWNRTISHANIVVPVSDKISVLEIHP